jgi:hypothetical protein
MIDNVYWWPDPATQHIGIFAMVVVVFVLVIALPPAIEWAYGFRRKRKKGSQKAA